MFFPFSLSIPQKVTKVNQELMAQRDKRYAQFFIIWEAVVPYLMPYRMCYLSFRFCRENLVEKDNVAWLAFPGKRWRMLWDSYWLHTTYSGYFNVTGRKP